MSFMFKKLDKRPWGDMWLLWKSDCYWIKIIHVKPYHRTSLQYHLRRTEYHIGLDHWHWAEIKPYAPHRMTAGWYIEYAVGWPKEEDIVRRADDYGRDLDHR